MNNIAKRSLNEHPSDIDPLEIRGTDFIWLPPNIIQVRNYAARETADQFKTINLSNFWLPETSFTNKPIQITSRPDLTKAIANAIRSYIFRTSKGSKSLHIQITMAARAMVKFFEYGWLNSIYSLSDWTPDDIDELLNKLKLGGWGAALDLNARTDKFIASQSIEKLRGYVECSHGKHLGYSLKSSFAAAIGTNLGKTELLNSRSALLQKLDLPEITNVERGEFSRRKLYSHTSGISATQLRMDMAWINLLAENLQNQGLSFIPFPYTSRLSKKFGRSNHRTQNIDPDMLGRILKESVFWLDEISGPLISILGDVVAGLSSEQTTNIERKSSILEAIATSQHKRLIEKKLGLSLRGIKSRNPKIETSLTALINGVASACFILIAFLNARRRDEIQHPKIGLHRQALRTVNSALRLYECDFYIEKTHRTYVPFYVGELTRRAIVALQQISDLARAMETVLEASPIADDAREDKLFQMPNFRPKEGPRWYSFNTNVNGASHQFMQRALGEGKSLRVHAHMFRRGYALLFHYRYENSTLMALAQQLGHFDLATARIYLDDTIRHVNGPSATDFGRGAHVIDSPQSQHCRALEEEIAAISNERIRELVSEVIAGDIQVRGGFARLVQRFHQRLSRNIEYHNLDRVAQGELLSDTLLDLGHAFRPLPHANCVSSNKRKNSSAACYSKDENRLAREDAGPSKCLSCPYVHYSSNHQQAWVRDLEELRLKLGAMAEDSLNRIQMTKEISNLERVIQLHNNRLQQSNEKNHSISK